MGGVMRISGLLLIAFPVVVYASSIYRCDTGGRVTYQDVPCAVGTGKNAKEPSQAESARARPHAESGSAGKSGSAGEQRAERGRERAAEGSRKAAAKDVLE
jgi:hypothetical protein